MSDIQIQVSATINASPDLIYSILTDYQEGHVAILPKKYFTGITILEGGQGAGTIIDVQMQVMGVEQELHLEVSEPEPGRVLAEIDKSAGVFTTFTIDPVEGGGSSRVTIATQAKASSGLRGWIEKLVNPLIIRRIYREELQQLAEYVQKNASSRSA
jgi:hypothetical protein